MKIYISHSSAYDYNLDLYQPLKEASFFSDYEFILPHQESATPLPVKELFNSKKINFVIAEISLPSTGQGIELAWANENNIQVVCFFKENSKYSSSLKFISNKFIEYKNQEDLINKIEAVLKSNSTIH